MRGSNELILNESTVAEALQLWADHTFKAPVVVKTVKQNANASNGSFTVSLTEPAPKPSGAEFRKLEQE